MSHYFLGIDIGTTSTKAIVFDKKGETVSKSTIEYSIYSPKADFREQNPDEILEAVIGTLKDSIEKANINAGDLEFISFSSMMHSIIAVDINGNPLTQCIIWNDNRSVSYVEQFKKNGKGREFYLKTGTPTHPMSPLYKLMWLKDNEPKVYNNAHKFISIKEYIFYKFFHEYIVDYSVASATGMFNIFKLKWDEDVLDLMKLGEEKLSRPVPTTHIMRNLEVEICARIGLSKQSVFVVGASDGCLANLGSNAIESGVAAATIGTSGAVRVVSDKPVTDDRERIFCYYLSENKYVVGGAINNGGIVYRWFRDEFAEIEMEQAKKFNMDPYVLLNEKIDEDLQCNLSVAAHLIHGSSDDRFSITYAVEKLTKAEVEEVNFGYMPLQEAYKIYNPERLKDGFNVMDNGEEIFYISNPALGLWADKSKFE